LHPIQLLALLTLNCGLDLHLDRDRHLLLPHLLHPPLQKESEQVELLELLSLFLLWWLVWFLSFSGAGFGLLDQTHLPDVTSYLNRVLIT
jgi:hypothetical protein